MKLLSPNVVSMLKKSSLPGTVFVEVDEFKARNGHNHKVVLAIVKRAEGWGNPTYVTLMDIKDLDDEMVWVINPWWNDELIERLVKLKTPARSMAHIPDDIIRQLVAEVEPLDSAVAVVIDAIVEAERKSTDELTRT